MAEVAEQLSKLADEMASVADALRANRSRVGADCRLAAGMGYASRFVEANAQELMS